MCAKVSLSSGESPRSQRGAIDLALSMNGNKAAQAPSAIPNTTQKAGDVVGEAERDVIAEYQAQENSSIWKSAWKIVTWTPPNCRWDPDRPPQFSMSSRLFFLCAI